MASPAPSAHAASSPWTAVWGTAMQEAAPFSGNNFTCRNITRITAAGATVRVRLSNVFVGAPTTINATTLAQRGTGGALVNGTLHTVTFGGSALVTIPGGGTVTSDPVSMAVFAGEDLATSTFISGAPTQFDNHELALVNLYCTDFGGTAGNHTTDVSTGAFTFTGGNGAWVSGIDVAGNAAGAVVALGDSITDGFGSTVNNYSTWPDVLSQRLMNANSGISVINEGIGGNHVVTAGGAGPTGVDRFSRDVLGQSNARTVILFDGSNDIATGADSTTVINGIIQLIVAAHSSGLRVIGATIIARHGGWGGSDATKDTIRGQVNQFIRTDSRFDAVIDFDVATRNTDPNYPSAGDPAYQQYLNPAYQHDFTHPNDAGYAAMANSIDLKRLGFGPIAAPGAKCVDVDTNTPTSGNRVQIWDCNSVKGQQWTVANDGTLRAFGKCMDIVGNGTANFSKIELWDCNGVGGQVWLPQTNGSLLNPQSGRCLDDPGWNTTNGTQLQIYDCNNLAPQVFRLSS
jgi:lysophospholipase L1-like esterase